MLGLELERRLTALVLLAVLSTAPLALAETASQQAETPQERNAAAPERTETAGEKPGRAPDLSEARDLVRQQKYAEAVEHLERLREEYPDNPDLLLMLGELLVAVGRTTDAREVLERCLELDPERPRVHFHLGSILAGAGERDAALEAFAREIELNDDAGVKVLSHLNRSLLLDRAGKPEQAARELEQVLALEPGRTEVYGDLATLQIEAGNAEAAAATLERGLGAGFRSARHFYSLGARFYRDGDWAEALEAFGRAREIDPSLAEAERSIAACLEQLGREDEALAHLRKYLELAPDAPDADEVAERLRAAGGS